MQLELGDLARWVCIVVARQLEALRECDLLHQVWNVHVVHHRVTCWAALLLTLRLAPTRVVLLRLLFLNGQALNFHSAAGAPRHYLFVALVARGWASLRFLLFEEPLRWCLRELELEERLLLDDRVGFIGRGTEWRGCFIFTSVLYLYRYLLRLLLHLQVLMEVFLRGAAELGRLQELRLLEAIAW